MKRKEVAGYKRRWRVRERRREEGEPYLSIDDESNLYVRGKHSECEPKPRATHVSHCVHV